MTNFKSTLCAALALTFAAGTALPVAAAPTFAPKLHSQAVEANVIDVQMRTDDRRWRVDRRHVRRDGRVERRNGRYYYNGHRGYRERRSGYRHYNGYWFPAGAFIVGAIIGGALNNAQPSSSYGSPHVRWCDDRYRTYRSSDNTFMSSAGYRKECNSPYS